MSTPNTAEQLTAPTLTASGPSYTSIQLSGLTNANASGVEIRKATASAEIVSAIPMTVVPSEGVYQVGGLEPNTNYYFQARFIGDNDDFLSSAWSTVVSGTTLALPTFDSTVVDVIKSVYPHGKLVPCMQMAFVARIVNAGTNTVIDKTKISSILFNVYKVTHSASGSTRSAITGFSNIDVPVSSLVTSLTQSNFWKVDETGINFTFIPDQRIHWLCETTGDYEFEFTFSSSTMNPLKIIFPVTIFAPNTI